MFMENNYRCCVMGGFSKGKGTKICLGSRNNRRVVAGALDSGNEGSRTAGSEILRFIPSADLDTAAYSKSIVGHVAKCHTFKWLGSFLKINNMSVYLIITVYDVTLKDKAHARSVRMN